MKSNVDVKIRKMIRTNDQAKKDLYDKRRKVTRPVEMLLCLLGSRGFTRDTIINALRHSNNKLVLCPGTISKYLKTNNIGLWDYRRGNTPEAKKIIKELTKK